MSCPPLNRSEQEFAIEHHDLVIRFLAINHLPAVDWYDVVIFRYLNSVHHWFNRLELHYYSFSTIAFNAMRSAVGNERKKQSRRIRTISLDDIVPGMDGMTYADICTRENLTYIPYVEATELQITYDVAIPERNSFRGGKKSDEVLAIEAFLQGTQKNMCFTYDDDKEAKRRHGTISSWKKKSPQGDLIDSFRNNSRIFIIRLSPKEVNERRVRNNEKSTETKGA